MNKLLFIIGLAVSINCLGQTKDSVAFCEVHIFINTALNPNYCYNIFTPQENGEVKISDIYPCLMPIGALKELGAKGWQLICFRMEDNSYLYTMQKIYKRK